MARAYYSSNKNFIRLAAALCLFLAGLQLPACAQDRDPYFLIGEESFTVQERDCPAEISLKQPPTFTEPDRDLGALALVNAGLAAWKVINNGAPSAEVAAAYASAIPAGMASNWSAVNKWTGPREYIYNYKVTNLKGIEVIKVKYKISYYYGGTEAGSDRSATTGDYIANFTVTPMTIDIKWGWHFDLAVGVSHPMNMGTVNKPLAFLLADLKWRVYTTLSKDGKFGVWNYTIDGLGNFRDLTAAEKALTREIPAPACPSPQSVFW